MKRLQATIFVDESSFDLQPKGNARAAVEVEADPLPWTDAQAKKRSAIRIHWTGAVMHGVGNVGFFLTTGTTWMRSRYKVLPIVTSSTLSTLTLRKEGDQVTLDVMQGDCTCTRASMSFINCNTSLIKPLHMCKSRWWILSIWKPCPSETADRACAWALQEPAFEGAKEAHQKSKGWWPKNFGQLKSKCEEI